MHRAAAPRESCTCEKQCLLTRVLSVCEGNSTNHPKTLLFMSGRNVFLQKLVPRKILIVKNGTKNEKIDRLTSGMHV